MAHSPRDAACVEVRVVVSSSPLLAQGHHCALPREFLEPLHGVSPSAIVVQVQAVGTHNLANLTCNSAVVAQ
eukprot:gene7855-7284_t